MEVTGSPATPGRKKTKLYVTAAAIIVVVAGVVASFFLIKRGAAESAAIPPPLTITPLHEEFLNLNRWSRADSGWNINPRMGNRLEIESSAPIAFLIDHNYESFTMQFYLMLINGGGASWALHVQNTSNYYLFYLSGPDGAYPNKFLTYIVRNSNFGLTRFVNTASALAELKAGGQYEIHVKVEKNRITHDIISAETGESIRLDNWEDEKDTFQYGSIGFRTVTSNQKFAIDDLFVYPPGAEPIEDQ